LFRIYGKGIEKFYESTFEIQVFKVLGEYGVAPKMIAEVEGGRIEEWIDGTPLHVSEMTNPSVMCSIGAIMGRLHKLAKDNPKFLPSRQRVPCLFHQLTSWCDNARRALYESTPSDEDRSVGDRRASPESSDGGSGCITPALFDEIDFEALSAEVDCVEALLTVGHSTDNVAHEVVFCHNDSQENNILRTGNCLRLIDFEYSDFNYVGFDVGNFFTEATLSYTVDDPPYYAVEPSDYPSLEARQMFASVYLSEYFEEAVLPSNPLVMPFLDSVERFAVVTHLLWGFWSLVRAQNAPTFTAFDYVSYAKDRFRLYWETKRAVLSKTQ